MFRLFNRTAFGFSTKSFDLAIIGGGPGGTLPPTQDTSLPSRPRSWVSILSALRSGERWAGPASTWAASPPRPSSTSPTNTTNSTTTSSPWVSTPPTSRWTGPRPRTTRTEWSLRSPRASRDSSARTRSPTSRDPVPSSTPITCKSPLIQ